MPTATGQPMLPVSAVCERLACSRTTAYRLIRTGALKAHKNPGPNGALRVSEESLDAYLAAHTVLPAHDTDVLAAAE